MAYKWISLVVRYQYMDILSIMCELQMNNLSILLII